MDSIQACIKCMICWEIIDKINHLSGYKCCNAFGEKCILAHLNRDKRGPNCREEILSFKMTKSLTLKNVINEAVKVINGDETLKCKKHLEKAHLYCRTGREVACLDCVCDNSHPDHEMKKLSEENKKEVESAKVLFENSDSSFSIFDKLEKNGEFSQQFGESVFSDITKEIFKSIEDTFDSQNCEVKKAFNIESDFRKEKIERLNSLKQKLWKLASGGEK